MARKNWSTLNEEMLHRGFAAMAFLRQYTNEQMGQQGIRLSDGRFSKLFVEQEFLVRANANGEQMEIYFCLGNACWAGLAWPVKEFKDADSNFTGLYLDPAGECQWIYLLDPAEWHVLTTSAATFQDRIFMVPNERKPLLKFFCASASRLNGLLVVDLQMVGSYLGLTAEEMKRLKKKDLTHKLLDLIGGEDAAFIAKVKADLEKPEKTKVIGDALDEFVFRELAQEDQTDFKHVADEVESRKKAGWAIVENKWKEGQKKRRAKAKAKPKSAPERKFLGRGKFAAASAKRKCTRKRKAEALEVTFLYPAVFFLRTVLFGVF